MRGCRTSPPTAAVPSGFNILCFRRGGPTPGCPSRDRFAISLQPLAGGRWVIAIAACLLLRGRDIPPRPVPCGAPRQPSQQYMNSYFVYVRRLFIIYIQYVVIYTWLQCWQGVCLASCWGAITTVLAAMLSLCGGGYHNSFFLFCLISSPSIWSVSPDAARRLPRPRRQT